MTEQEAVRYTVEGVELTAHKDENGCLLIARADKEPSYSSNLAVEIRPDLSVRRGMVPGTTGRKWFKLFTRPGSGEPPFGTADTLEKAVEQAEAKLLEAAHWEVVAALSSASGARAREILDNKIDQWLERKHSGDGCKG